MIDNMKSIQTPRIDTLALLAAIVSQGGNKIPEEAVRYACEIWVESEDALNVTLPALQAAKCFLKIDPVAWKDRTPKRFPATLNDFLRLIVRATTVADGTKQLRDFYRHRAKTNDPDTEAENTIRQIKETDKAGGYFTRNKWYSEARSYDWWWENAHASDISAKRRSGGAKGLASSKRKEGKWGAHKSKPDKRKGARPPKERLRQALLAADGGLDTISPPLNP